MNEIVGVYAMAQTKCMEQETNGPMLYSKEAL